MSTAYDERQRYRLYLAPDKGPIIAVAIDGQRVSAARMMSDESAVAEIIRQISTDSRYRDQITDLQFDDPRARASLKSILPHMQVIHQIAGMVVQIPGSAPGDAAGGAQKSSISTPDEIRQIEDRWQKKLDAQTRQHEQAIKYLQREHEEAIEMARSQAQAQIQGARQRNRELESERDQALKRAATLEAKHQIDEATERQGSEQLRAEVSRLSGVVTEREREIAQVKADLQAAAQREEEARDTAQRAREEARLLQGKIAHMKQEDQKRRASNLQALAGLAGGYPGDDGL